MGIEIQMTGLGLINLSTNPPQLECPDVTDHQIDVLVEAAEGSTWSNTRLLDWEISLDGVEMFVLEGGSIASLDFLGTSSGTPMVLLDDIMRPSFLGYSGYSTPSGAFVLPIDRGKLTGVHWIMEADGQTKACFRRSTEQGPTGPAKNFTEHVLWSVPQATALQVNFQNGDWLKVPVGVEKLRTVISNDVTRVGGGRFDPGFHHWMNTASRPLGLAGNFMHPTHCSGTLTAKPICHLLAVD